MVKEDKSEYLKYFFLEALVLIVDMLQSRELSRERAKDMVVTIIKYAEVVLTQESDEIHADLLVSIKEELPEISDYIQFYFEKVAGKK